jgi:hypothetical protein
MAFSSLPNVGEQVNRTYLISDAVTDNDLGKPVSLTATDTVSLAADGGEIYGFINSLEVGTSGGKNVVGVVVSGRVRVTLSGACALGSHIEAAANAAAGVAKTTDWGAVSIHTLDTTSVATLAASTFKKNWILISGAGTDGTNGVIESV